MASITIIYTDNGDGTASATSAAGAPSQKITTKSVNELQNVAAGWVQQSIPGLLQ